MNFHPLTVRCAWESPLGPMSLSASPTGLSGVFFDDQRHLPDMHSWPQVTHNVFIHQTILWLHAYFDGQVEALKQPFTVPLDLQGGTDFQQSVWHALLRIPAGQTESYGQVAQHLNKPQAVRAVGAAVGRNPIGIIVPCHRIVGASGQLTGYAGGLWRKEKLLQLENACPAVAAHRLTPTLF